MMCLDIRHFNHKYEDPFSARHIVDIREGTLNFTGISTTVEILVKLPHVIIFNNLLTCCIGNQGVDRYSLLFI